MSYMEQLSARNGDLQLENAKLREALENERRFSEQWRLAHFELSARLAARDPEAANSQGDEAWALNSAVTIHPAVTSESFAPTSWSVRYCDGVRTLEESANTISAALRALRMTVNGGAK